MNLVADGLSQKCVNLKLESGDGHEWTVSEDWDAGTGLTNDLFSMGTTTLQEMSTAEYEMLQKMFSQDTVFPKVIEALYEMDKGDSLRKQKRAHHKAENFMVSEGRQWRVGDISLVRV